MGLVRSRNTKPEMIVRRLIHGMGYRYRLHDRTLPGTPDIVFRSHRKAVFVHGCFWHRHRCASGNRTPKSRTDFWVPKLDANKLRDAKHRRALAAQGWRVLTIWECQVSNEEGLRQRLRHFLRQGAAKTNQSQRTSSGFHG
jgi:DNA mismatch endonuclease (patch repair protein)